MKSERWCRENGFVYTGMSERDKDVLKPRLEELRTKGYTAYLVQWKRDHLARSGGTGFSIFVDKRWAWDEEEKRISARLDEMPVRSIAAEKRFRKEMEDLATEELELQQQLAALRVKQMGGPW